MMAYRVRFTHSAERAFAVLPQPARIRIEAALENFAANPFHHHDVRKVKGCPPDKPRYRLRVGEDPGEFPDHPRAPDCLRGCRGEEEKFRVPDPCSRTAPGR